MVSQLLLSRPCGGNPHASDCPIATGPIGCILMPGSSRYQSLVGMTHDATELTYPLGEHV